MSQWLVQIYTSAQSFPRRECGIFGRISHDPPPSTPLPPSESSFYTPTFARRHLSQLDLQSHFLPRAICAEIASISTKHNRTTHPHRSPIPAHSPWSRVPVHKVNLDCAPDRDTEAGARAVFDKAFSFLTIVGAILLGVSLQLEAHRRNSCYNCTACAATRSSSGCHFCSL
jgi:hypothetical protein